MKSLKVKIIIGIVVTSAIVITSILVIRNNTDKENIDFASQNINENYSNNENTITNDIEDNVIENISQSVNANEIENTTNGTSTNNIANKTNSSNASSSNKNNISNSSTNNTSNNSSSSSNKPTANNTTNNTNTNASNNNSSNTSTDTNNTTNNESTNNNTNIDNNDTTIKKEYLEGYEIAGYIKIPKTNIDIPILSQATVKTLDLSVAIMYGVGLNNVGNNVIMGIDFFKDNSKLSIGDTIYITDQTKNEVLYEIYDIQKLKASDSSYYERDTKGKKEITLVTYNTDVTYNRLVIFAKQK